MSKLHTAASAVSATLLFMTSTAFAHTTIRSQATEGVTEDNAIRISHTCETPSGDHIPVTAISIVFPTMSPTITGSDDSVVGSMAEVIEQGTLAGLARPLQDKSIFDTQRQKKDTLENVIGFAGMNGSLDPEIPGRYPFQFAAPRFVQNSCARRLLIRVAIADICIAGFGVGDSLQFGKVNMWVPANNSYLSNVGGYMGIDGIGAPATLTVNRNLTTNPLPAACGNGIDVTVTHSPEDIDTNLPIPGLWP